MSDHPDDSQPSEAEEDQQFAAEIAKGDPQEISPQAIRDQLLKEALAEQSEGRKNEAVRLRAVAECREMMRTFLGIPETSLPILTEHNQAVISSFIDKTMPWVADTLVEIMTMGDEG